MNAHAMRKLWMRCVTAGRRIASVPDYDAYIAHLRAHHPERSPPTRAAFFAERERARYRGINRCC